MKFKFDSKAKQEKNKINFFHLRSFASKQCYQIYFYQINKTIFVAFAGGRKEENCWKQILFLELLFINCAVSFLAFNDNRKLGWVAEI